MTIKFWETAPSSTGPGYTMKAIEFASADEAVEYARAAAPAYQRVESRGTYVVANTTDSSHTLEIGRKGDQTASQIMIQLIA